ncbi:ribonuclease HII [Skermanella aerolata]|uniref:Ribonuclease HII n=1 Tax=Skermanella aerolata TaxID=393310 RepID=A0A512DZP6_9PROT|nr:ribonuclease HII [Skermanella aerolata]KJB92140.1 ribonuclease HII [Skermanella aerolata KACC 11604]GEO41680.1 ribonuclease HII [Skermanella aerolata]
MPDLYHEIAAGYGTGVIVCGVDEVGRGPLAGPVVAAAAVLPPEGLPPALAALVNDSKLLKPKVREELAPLILGCCRVAVGMADVGEIDRLNILHASLLAMKRAVEGLGITPGVALIDGNRTPDLSCAMRTIVGGDAASLSIAAASVVAKVERDRIMAELALAYPGYGWERNAGYPTIEHRKALISLGITPHHRRSFGPVKAVLAATV